jgi:PAS domain S-box-containing protein
VQGKRKQRRCFFRRCRGKGDILSLPLLPLHIIDFVGAALMIVLSVSATFYALKLHRLKPRSIIWGYFFWFSVTLLVFAVSRSSAHIIKYILVLLDVKHVWTFMLPYSGGLNTMTFIAFTTLTIYFYNVRKTHELLKEETDKLEKAHEELRELNQTLETRVQERTLELRKSEMKFRRLFEQSRDAVFFCDSRWNISDVNASGIICLGYENKADVLRRPFASLFKEEDEWKEFQNRIVSDGHIEDFETSFVRCDGSVLVMLISASAIRGEDEYMTDMEDRGCEVIAKDITQFKNLTKTIIQSEKMASIGQLAAGVAHEINTPLGIILGYTQLLQEDHNADAETMETLEIIEKQTRVCKKIVADLLKFSRKSVENATVVTDINECIEEVLSVTEHTLNMDRIYVHREFTEDLPPVMSDREKLRQVFVNLLNNAHYAMESEGIVGIWTYYSEDEGMIEVAIGDTGPGIPDDIIDKVFDPFFTTKAVGKGTGLGLSVSFGIVRDHGGSMSVQSPPEDEKFRKAGMETVFFIRLPYVIPEDSGTNE